MTGTKKIKIRHLITLSFLAISTLFVVSCNFSGESDDSKNTARQENTVTIHGTFTLQGAVPSSLHSTASRSAVPSLPEGVSFSVKAKSAKEETMTAYNISSDGQFEIKLTRGEWTLSAEIKKDGTTILSGKSDKISITAEKPIYDEIFIIVKPDSSTGNGTVNLPVNIEETSGIKTAQISWQESSTTRAQKLDFVSNTRAAFTMGGTDIPSGAYTAVFQFYSSEADGKRLLYQCTETINVCSNLCTDSWLKNGTTSSPWLTESDDKVTFTVTKSLVEKFAQTSFFVQGTGETTYEPKTPAGYANNGTYFDPLSTVQKAVDKIIQINDGETEYSIFIDGTVTAPDDLASLVTPNFIKIEPQKKLNLKIASLSSTQAVINANTKAGVIDVVGASATEQTTLILQNVCITGGKTQIDGFGGGIKAENASITLKAGTVIGTKLLPEENKNNVASSLTYGNYAAKGGGIYLNGCTLTIENDVYICQNYSENEGGGIAAEGNSKIIAKGGIIGFNKADSNTAGNGGGIYISSGNAELTDCTVCLNKAGNNGGGIYVADTELTLNAGTVIGNKNASQTANLSNWNNYAYYNGGGIYAKNASVTVNEDSAVLFNVTARDSGGGLCVEDGTLTIENAKINYNYSSTNNYQGSGGGLRLAGTAKMEMNGSDSEIAYNGSAFRGAGIQLIETSSCTMTGGSIHDNKNYGTYGGEEGGGVYISSGTTFTMTGGTIYGNKYGTSKAYGNAIYVDGTLNLSGTAYIDPDNDVYLADGTYVTVTGKLTGTLPVAMLTPNAYDDRRTMLKSGGRYTLQKEDCDKFAVTKDTLSFYRVSFDDSSTTGILKEAKLTAKAELPCVKFTPVTNVVYTSNIKAGSQDISFTVQKKTSDTDWGTITPSKAKTALYQNGSEIKNHSAESSSLNLASWLPEGEYKLYMCATVDGIEYSAWETFTISNKIPISSLSSAPDAANYPSLAAETSDDFIKLGEWMKNGATMEGITITLMEDIDFTTETEWLPIGYTGNTSNTFHETYGTHFKGTLDGNGKSIQFGINSSTQKMIGLVQINDGIIENLVIEKYTKDDMQIGSSSSNVSRGGAFCVVNNGTIRNCINKANLKVYTFWDVGGICMLNYGTIENCMNTGNITMTNNAAAWEGCYQKAGGIAGQNNNGKIYNCVNTGKISTQSLVDVRDQQSNLSGTISSMLINDAQIKNCYWLKNCLSRGGSQSNQVVYFKSSGTSNVNSFPGTATVEGCGYFESFTASAPLTAGDVDSCKYAQALSYGTTLIDALNGYVNANPDKELKQWQPAEDGTITLGF